MDIWIVEDSMGVICLCASEELAKEYAERFWCSYCKTKVIHNNNQDPAGDVPTIYDPAKE